MKRLKFDEFLLEVLDNDIIKVAYKTKSELEDDINSSEDNTSSYEEKISKLDLSPTDEQAIKVDLDELKKRKLTATRLEMLGKRLYKILFHPEIHNLFVLALNNLGTHSDERNLRIIIAYPEGSKVARWPLEALHCPSPDIWLATDTRLSLTRKLTGGRWKSPIKKPPLKILVVVSSPLKKPEVMSTAVLESLIDWAESTRVKPASEEKRSEFRRQQAQPEIVSSASAQIEVKVLGQINDFKSKSNTPSTIYLDRPAGLPVFTNLITTWKPQVLHFIGHGDVHEELGRLAFVNEHNGEAQWIDAKQLAQYIIPTRGLQLVVLQVCKSADSDAQLSLATSMIRNDIPAVVAMQFEIEKYCAIAFVSHFYQMLAERNDVDYAVQLARNHITLIYNPGTHEMQQWNNREFCTPVIYTRMPGTIIELVSVDQERIPGKSETTWSSQSSEPALPVLRKVPQDQIAGRPKMIESSSQIGPAGAIKGASKTKSSSSNS